MKKRLIAITAAVSMLAAPAAAIGAPDPSRFADIKGHWAEPVITEAVQADLMQGIGENAQGQIIFAPTGLVSRAQAASALTRAFNIDYGDYRFVKEPQATDYYRDVDNNTWYAQAAILCALHEVMTDIDYSGKFYADRSISRLEMARAIQRSFTVKKINVPMIMLMPYFEDTGNLPNDDMNSIVFVNNTGIMKGNNGYFRPHDPLTRAELARVILACKQVMDMQTEADQHKEVPLFIKLVKEYGEYMDEDLHIPVIGENSNVTMKEQINARFEEDASKFKQEVASTLDEYIKGAEISGYPIHRYQAFSRIHEGLNNQQYLSLYIDYYSYTGGAHGMTVRQAYNYDLKTGKQLALADLFKPSYDYKTFINQAIREQISTQADVFFEGEMGFNGISDQQPYYLKDGQLIVYFGLYEIAPYAAGIQEFRIPLFDLQDNLNFSGLID